MNASEYPDSRDNTIICFRSTEATTAIACSLYQNAEWLDARMVRRENGKK